MRRSLLSLTLIPLLLAGGAAAAGATRIATGRVGPKYRLTNYGHLLHPAGRLTTVGDFPTGGALSTNGRYFWVVDAGHGRDDARIIDVRTGRVIQVLPLPGAYVGVALSRDGHWAYVSGEPIGDSKPTGPTKGNQGDVIHVFSVDPRTGRATERDPIKLPALSGGTAQSHANNIEGITPPGPTQGSALDWPEGMGISRDGRTLVVALDQADQVAIIDTRTRQVRTVKVGAYPYTATITPDGRTAYVTNEGAGTVSVVDVSSAQVSATVDVGGPLGSAYSHPEGEVLDPADRYLYVAVASRDLVAVVDTRSNTVARYLSVAQGGALGTEPIAVGVSPDGTRLFVADAGEDALDEIALKANRRTHLRAFTTVGRIPTAAYPTAVAVTPDGRRLIWLAAEGLGAGPNPDYGTFFANSDKAPYATYVPDMLLGRVGVLKLPNSSVQLRRLSQLALHQSLPSDLSSAPSGTPLRPGGPIRYVFYIVKENRTYDQLFGTDPRGDGDPKLELFDDNGVKTPAGGVTPNAHALVRRFPLLDHFYADSEVSVDGHLITSGGYAVDYAKKALHPNYSNRGKVDEFGSYPITLPPNDFLFDQAVRQGISFRNYGELNAGVLPGADDGRPTYTSVGANTDFEYPFFFGCEFAPSTVDRNAVCHSDSGTPGLAGNAGVSHSRFDFFQQQFQSQLAAGTVPQFNYLTLPNDHTNGVKVGYPTPRALVADNDLGLGQIVDLISHSSIWAQSAIFVVEDDSQDGADHVDAHRMPAYVISPWTREGAVVHARYDQESVIRSIELILGMKPLSRFDADAEPMYEAFRTGGAPDTAPYSAITPEQSLGQLTSQGEADEAGPLAAELPFDQPDVVPQALFDQVLWRSVYGPHSTPPPPGPDASTVEAGRAAGALDVFAHGGNVRAWLLSHTPDPVGDDIAQTRSLLAGRR